MGGWWTGWFSFLVELNKLNCYKSVNYIDMTANQEKKKKKNI